MHFNSTYEAYTHILIKMKEIESSREKLKVDMDYLLMNIRKGNFDIKENKAHAVKELGYLITSSKRLALKAEQMTDIAQKLLNDLL